MAAIAHQDAKEIKNGIVNMDAKEIKNGIVNIHKMLELRKMHMKHVRTGIGCGVCESVCHELGLQKQTIEAIERYPLQIH